MKKASIQLSINFLVVMIICLVLLGIGIKLIADFSGTAHELEKDVNEQHKQRLKTALDEGAPVSAFPNIVTVDPGKYADFSIGIANELGQETDFFIDITHTSTLAGELETLFIKGPYDIKNNQQKYIPVRIIVPKDAEKGSRIFNLDVCTDKTCSESYGRPLNLQVNVR